MSEKILIFGNGFMGRRLQEFFKCDLSVSRISSLSDALAEIKKYKPKIVINCIGLTGKNSVDDCEIDKDKTLFANTFVPLILAEACLRNRIKLIHISSGCIYHYDYLRDKPIKEEKIPDFFDLYYSRTKIYAERALDALAGNYNILIARIRIPLDNRPHPKNILTKLIKYKKVIDLPNSVTYVPDFIVALEHLIKVNAKGIYNVVNKGALRYPEFMKIYKKYSSGFEFKVIDYKKLNLVRTNLVMSTKKLEKSGFRMRNINEVLEECVKDYLKY